MCAYYASSMSLSMLVLHVVALVVILALIIVPIWGWVRERRAHAEDVRRLEAEAEALRGQVAAWQAASHDL